MLMECLGNLPIGCAPWWKLHNLLILLITINDWTIHHPYFLICQLHFTCHMFECFIKLWARRWCCNLVGICPSAFQTDCLECLLLYFRLPRVHCFILVSYELSLQHNTYAIFISVLASSIRALLSNIFINASIITHIYIVGFAAVKIQPLIIV